MRKPNDNVEQTCADCDEALSFRKNPKHKETEEVYCDLKELWIDSATPLCKESPNK